MVSVNLKKIFWAKKLLFYLKSFDCTPSKSNKSIFIANIPFIDFVSATDWKTIEYKILKLLLRKQRENIK